MPTLRRVRRVVRDPALVVDAWRAWRSPSRLFRRYTRLAADAGVKRLFFILSFDCDAPEDIEASMALQPRLSAIGVQPVLAVPGELLVLGRTAYRGIAAAGCEFVNHGYTQHVYWDVRTRVYASSHFYDRLTRAEALRDIERGEAAFREVLGVDPIGFRTPHFGTFQTPAELRWLHRVLKERGYRFSSSTMPYMAYRYGPVFTTFGLPEIPLSGYFSHPLRVLDTWGCCEAPGRTMTMDDYRRESLRMAHFFQDAGSIGLLNYYVDPRHVAGDPVFFETIDALKVLSQNVTYSSIVTALAGC